MMYIKNILVIVFLSFFCMGFSKITEKSDALNSTLLNSENSVNLFNHASKGDDQSLEKLLIEASRSTSEIMPVQLVYLLIQNYDRVSFVVNKLNDEHLVDKKVSIAIFRAGCLEYHLDFSKKELMNFVDKNKKKYSNDSFFSSIFNEETLGFAKASSILEAAKYSPQKIRDGDYATAWVEGDKGSGLNQWLEIFNQSNYPDRNIYKSLKIINGYAKSEATYKTNNRVRKALLEFSDGQKQIIELKDTMEPQIVTFNESIIQSVKLTILDVYKGTKYNDTCISEIEFMY